MLVYESAEELLAEPEPRRYLHIVTLNALRDKATQLEVRFGADGGLLYYRIDGRDWELVPPPDDIYPLLKDAVRETARLVQPERPELTVIAGVPGARYEPLESAYNGFDEFTTQHPDEVKKVLLASFVDSAVKDFFAASKFLRRVLDAPKLDKREYVKRVNEMIEKYNALIQRTNSL